METVRKTTNEQITDTCYILIAQLKALGHSDHEITVIASTMLGLVLSQIAKNAAKAKIVYDRSARLTCKVWEIKTKRKGWLTDDEARKVAKNPSQRLQPNSVRKEKIRTLPASYKGR